MTACSDCDLMIVVALYENTYALFKVQVKLELLEVVYGYSEFHS